MLARIAIVPAIALTLVAGCGVAPRGANYAGESLGTATIAGVVYLPQGVAPAGACGALSIQAMQGSMAIGDSHVVESHRRCSYELTRLPTDVDLTVRVSLPVCAGGTSAVISPAREPVRLERDETRTRDYKSTCAAGNTIMARAGN